MCDEWMPTIKLPLTPDQFHQLPRNPAYKYEYLDSQTYLSPRPRHYHALLDLERRTVPADLPLSPGFTIRTGQTCCRYFAASSLHPAVWKPG